MSCQECRLCKTSKRIQLMGTGKRNARIMIVQESPYEVEVKAGQYMRGRGGKMFKEALSEIGVDLDDCYFTAVVKCGTPGDRLPLDDEIKACQETLLAEVEVIQPEIIIPTGNTSLKALTGLTAITKQRGRLIEKKGHKFFPIIHPNMVLKQPRYLETFSKDILNLEALLNGSTPSNILAFEKERKYCDTYEEAIEEIKRFIDLPAGSSIVLDLETVKNNPFIPVTKMSDKYKSLYPSDYIPRPKIVGIGLSDKPGYGASIPLYHRQTPLLGNQIGTIVKFLRILFSREDVDFIGHNGKFDVKWLNAQLDIVMKNFNWDTILMHYLAVTEEKGTHGLKELAWLETDMGGYDDILDELKPKGEDDKGNYDLIDWDILKVYLADDVDCTQRLLYKYKPLIEKNPELNWIWKELMVPGLATLLDIETNGVFLNQDWLAKLEKTYPIEIQRIYDKLHQFPEVLQIERESMAKWEERVAIGAIKKINRTEEQSQKFIKYKKYDPTKGGVEFNFGSTQQLKELLFVKLNLETPILTDKGEKLKRVDPTKISWEYFSTKDESLKIMKDQHPIVEILMEYRKVNHLYNNFVLTMRDYVDLNGIVHPTYNLFGTVTGRLSSNDPNFQQMPRKCNDIFLFQYWNEIKSLFTSRFGDEGVIIQFDYSQLELRILAVFSQDKNLIELYKSGVDLHRAIAAEAFGKDMEEITKDERTASKKVQFGIVYQESPGGLSDDLRGEGIDMSIEDCELFIEKYFKKYPQVAKWIDSIKRYAKKNRYVKSLLNRIRHLPNLYSTDKSLANEALRQAVNAPIQSTGSDCTLQSLIQINKWLKQSKKRSVICGTVHDSIVLDCLKSEVIEVSKKVKHIMEHLAEYHEFYKFLGDVPIVSEMEIGYSYGASFECTIEELEEKGIDSFLQEQLNEKHDKERKAFKEADEKGGKVPVYVEGYWDDYTCQD